MKRARDLAVLVASAAVLAIGAAGARRSIAPPAASDAPAASLEMPELPPGAPFDEPPGADEVEKSCRFEERGFGDYGEWRALPRGRALVPTADALDGDGAFRLLVHFHGGEAARKALAPERLPIAIAALDLGVGSAAYQRGFASDRALDELVRAVEREVAARTGVAAAHAQPIVLSSWSAGYGAIADVLARPRDRARVAGVVLLDSLYASRPIARAQIAPFVEFAASAARGDGFFYFAHTEIATSYASTREVARFLLREVGVDAAPVDADPRAPFALQSSAERAGLVVRGYAGADKDAHCAALHLLPEVVKKHVLALPRALAAPPR